MFAEYEVVEWVGLPPETVMEGGDIDAAALKKLRDSMEGLFDSELGIIVAVESAKVESEGYSLPISGDPNIYFLVRYKVLTFEPVLHEVVKGVVRDVREQGIFVDLGPVDGFVHRHQIIDENVELSVDKRGFKSVESNKTVEIGDHVRARIVQISAVAGRSPRSLRIGMTMRQPYLGKEEWIRG